MIQIAALGKRGSSNVYRAIIDAHLYATVSSGTSPINKPFLSLYTSGTAYNYWEDQIVIDPNIVFNPIKSIGYFYRPFWNGEDGPMPSGGSASESFGVLGNIMLSNKGTFQTIALDSGLLTISNDTKDALTLEPRLISVAGMQPFDCLPNDSIDVLGLSQYAQGTGKLILHFYDIDMPVWNRVNCGPGMYTLL